MKKLIWLLFPLLLAGTVSGQSLANLPDVNLLLQGAKVYAQDGGNTYLGSITNELNQDSIFNWVGPYGSTLSQTSIWNELSPYGIETGKYSACNELSKTPPKIVKGGKVIGYITKNATIYNRISPWQLKSIKDQLAQ